MIKHLKYTSVSVPPTYEELFRKAVLTFQHQRVYDLISEAIVHLYDISNVADDELEFLGPYPFYGTSLDVQFIKLACYG